MDLIAIKKLGEELGHEGPELRNFVDRQVQLYEEQQNSERKNMTMIQTAVMIPNTLQRQ